MKALNQRQFLIISNLWFSAFWFTCVYAANNLELSYQVSFGLLLLAPALILAKFRPLDIKLVLLITILGSAMDYGLFKLGLHQFINDQFPLWLNLLWLGFGLYVGLIHQDLRAFNPIVLVCAASILTPISYAYGITIGLIHWPLGPVYSYLILCCAWLAFICTIILVRFLMPLNWPQLGVLLLASSIMVFPNYAKANAAKSYQLSELSELSEQTPWQQWPKIGSAQLNVLFWTVYDSSLSTPTGQYKVQQPLALSIDYRMDIKAEDLIEATQEQWDHLGFSKTQQQKWTPSLQALWPDIKENDNLTFVILTDKASFYFNKKHLGDIEDMELAQAFIDIWLSEKTQYKKLRKQLIDL